MSIINQALKKAQRGQQSAQGGAAWVLPASTGASMPRRRGHTLWIVTAALFALSLGATLYAWLGSPTAHVGTVLEPAPSATVSIPQPQPAQATKATGSSSISAHRISNPVPKQQPAQTRTAGITPVRPVQIAAGRRPTPPAAAVADYTARGNALFREGEYHRAIDMYQSALALNPLDVKARNNLGNAYMQLTMDDRAIAAFQEVLRLDDSYSLAYYNLACAHARSGRVENAAAYLQQAMLIEPEASVWARTDSDFASVRNTPEFRQLLEPR